eukprot:scaffold14902_cov39-Cyclotella_meneghiniana.AAC.1
MSHQANKRQKHSPSSGGLSGLQVSPPDASHWMQMRQEIMDSLRAELQNDLQSQKVDQLKDECRMLQNDFQSQVDQLKETVAQLEGEASREKAEKSELKHQSVGQLENENSQLSKVASLEEKVKSLENVVKLVQQPRVDQLEKE